LISIFDLIEQLTGDFSDLFIRDLKKYYRAQRHQIDGFMEGELKERFKNNLIEGRGGGWYRKSLRIAHLTGTYFWTISMLMERPYSSPAGPLKPQTISEMNTNYLLGLTNFSSDGENKSLHFKK